MQILSVNPRHPSPAVIREAARIIKAGGVVAFPTETIYGLAANALDAKAVRRIFKAKGRPEGKPLIVLVEKLRDVQRVARNVSKEAKKLMQAFWPGPLTIVLKKRKNVSKETAGGGTTIAVRVSPHPIAQALVRAAGVPITATSANLAGKPSNSTATGVKKAFKNSKFVDLLLDAGKTAGGVSTLIDCTAPPPQLLREGTIRQQDFIKYLK